MSCPTLSLECETNDRSPEVSLTAFGAQPPDLQPVPWMDRGFAIKRPLARHRMPHIRFLFIGSHLCSTLLSDPASRRRRCASRSLHLHQVVKGTFTSKLSNMLGTRNYPPAKPGALVCEPLKAAAGALSRPRKTIVERWYRKSWRSLPQFPIRIRAAGFRRFAEFHCGHRNVFTELSHSTPCSRVNLRATYCGSCQTFAASPAEPGGLPTD